MKKSNTGKYNFQKLTPIRDADIAVYKEALEFVFANAQKKSWNCMKK